MAALCVQRQRQPPHDFQTFAGWAPGWLAARVLGRIDHRRGAVSDANITTVRRKRAAKKKNNIHLHTSGSSAAHVDEPGKRRAPVLVDVAR